MGREHSATLNAILKYSAKNGDTITHTQMDGGKYNLSGYTTCGNKSRLDLLYEKAAIDIANGNMISLAVMRSRIFPLFADWDVELPDNVEFTIESVFEAVKIAMLN